MRKILTMKHQAHSAKDLDIDYEFDLIKRTIKLEVEWIDSLLLTWWLQIHLLSEMNAKLEGIGKMQLLKHLRGFKIKLTVAQKIRFDLTLVEHDYDAQKATLVMKLQD